MPISYNKASVVVSLQSIIANYRRIRTVAQRPMPVIKSDAYGHGLEAVGMALEAEGARECAVGTVGEGAKLRKAGFGADIVALLGALDREDAQLAASSGIIPTVLDIAGLERLAAQGTTERPVRVALKFDTGMARLGFTEHDVSALCERLRTLPSVRPVMAVSHLAVADDPTQSAFTMAQGAAFARIMAGLRSNFPDIMGSLSNSAATLAHPQLHWDVQRPGIALYGSNPLRGTALARHGEGLLPAMSVSVPVLQVHPLPAGRSISYGRTYTATKDATVAIIAAGYADNYSRALSGRGVAVAGGRRVPVLGRVCMQTTAIDVTDVPGIATGDRVWLLGGPGPATVSADELADLWGTISYEVLCLLGMNPRRHDDSVE
ncbi:alanine racemase [Nitratidesulfovibrio vulgaris]|jgi:alanine racemase|uniref:Alanine racemase n=1 Tax=Nitratidesulfovibrio vulgaris (strain DP4) TaxID=391774 RepID=ALR_NITV4|nr:alanine racemase [Nitratidesulfovibrio vulgaris]A1VF31.1 RecName: Full=Alanine racemase [Nitratidesulfovibrio vulgaris DP4]ABM29047.1 alanine racemase [Nitratidesulfovibrio vulgaris DP4]WCB47601.1 alanine racemase [Nitratidesulfovibrio vulgaris]GEB81224.1 alanine racemase [Desulfovibrio desulfuricans]